MSQCVETTEFGLKKAHSEYKIVISYGEGKTRHEWSIWRRYADIRGFFLKLKKQLGVCYADFPEKKMNMFGMSHDLDTQIDRVVAFQDFFK
jgi:hypothetical protein